MVQPPQQQERRNTFLSVRVNVSGIFYNLWSALREKFNLPLPNVAITCGWPSRKCRGKASRRAPGEIIVEEWKGDEQIEKAFVSIHPERFQNVEQVALSVLYVVGNEVYGSRRNLGATALGVELNKESGMLEYLPDDKGKHAKTVLKDIIKQTGPVPAGFAEMPEPKAVERTRQRKYTCSVCNQIIRAGTDTLGALCTHQGTKFVGAAPGSFVLHVPKTKQPQPEPVNNVPAQYTQHTTPAQRADIASAVKTSASAGRMFAA